MIVLHIGTGKTGSTAIQKLISTNRKVFEERGWLYPINIGNLGYCHARLGIALTKNNSDTLQELSDEVRACPLKNILLSYELFYNQPEVKIETLITTLRALNKGEIRIIIYLRRQDEILESSTLQSLKDGHSEKLNLSKNMYNLEFNYNAIIQKWEKFISKENIIIRPYGKAFLPHPNSLLKDFFYYAMGIDFNEIKEELIFTGKDPNPSLDAVSGEVLDFFADIVKQEYRDVLVSQLLAIQNQDGVSKSKLFCKKDRKLIMELFQEGNKALLERYHLPETLFRFDDKEHMKPTQEEISKRIFRLYQRKECLFPFAHWGGKDGKLIDIIMANKIILLDGFHGVEKWGVWTKGSEISRLAFMVFRDFYNANRYIDIIIKTKWLPNSKTLSWIKARDGEWMQLSGDNRYRLSTEGIKKDGGVVFVEFRHEHVVSPSVSIKGSTDERVMGCGIKVLGFEEII